MQGFECQFSRKWTQAQGGGRHQLRRDWQRMSAAPEQARAQIGDGGASADL